MATPLAQLLEARGLGNTVAPIEGYGMDLASFQAMEQGDLEAMCSQLGFGSGFRLRLKNAQAGAVAAPAQSVGTTVSAAAAGASPTPTGTMPAVAACSSSPVLQATVVGPPAPSPQVATYRSKPFPVNVAAQTLGMQVGDDLTITNVTWGSVEQAAGVWPGSKVVAVNSTPVADKRGFFHALAPAATAGPVTLELTQPTAAPAPAPTLGSLPNVPAPHPTTPCPPGGGSAHARSETSVTMETAADPPVICVGDLHGHIDKAKQLWAALQSELGVTTVNAARVVFLGDYVDRGPNSREVLDWLIELEASRDPGTTAFLAGNHDFAFGCFLGCLDVVPTGFDLDGTRNPSYTSGYWTPPVEGGMHYQGRRWGGDGNADIYDAKKTFESYGVQYAHTAEARDALVAAVPQAHKDFLRRLLWVYDAPVSFAPGRLVCAHAGLLTDGSLEEQLAGLHAKNLEARALQVGGYGRFEALSGRAEVERMHPELAGRALLVSGHHGYTQQSGDRLIVDTSGGRYGDENPIEAVVLPCRKLVSSSGRPGSWSRDPPRRRQRRGRK